MEAPLVEHAVGAHEPRGGARPAVGADEAPLAVERLEVGAERHVAHVREPLAELRQGHAAELVHQLDYGTPPFLHGPSSPRGNAFRAACA